MSERNKDAFGMPIIINGNTCAWKSSFERNERITELRNRRKNPGRYFTIEEENELWDLLMIDNPYLFSRDPYVDLDKEITRYKELVSKLEEYIQLLGNELEEVIPIALSNGWESKRVEDITRLSNEIDKLKEK